MNQPGDSQDGDDVDTSVESTASTKPEPEPPKVADITPPVEDKPSTPDVIVPPVSSKAKFKKKWLLIIVVVLIVLIGLGAFWYFRDHKSNQTATAKTNKNITTLVYAVHWTENSQLYGIKNSKGQVVTWGLKQYLDEYTKLHPDVRFVIEQIAYANYPTQLPILAASGAGPDIYQIYSTWAPSLVQAGLLATPPASVIKDVQSNYISTAGVTVNGKIWGYPTEVDNYALLYNKTLFKQAGIVDAQGNPVAPKTWADVITDAAKLTKKNAQGQITQYGFAFLENNSWESSDPFLSLLFSNGGSYLSSDYKTCEVNSPAGVAALNDELQLFQDGSTDVNGNFYNFGNGSVGMVISPPWTKSTFAANFGSSFSSTVGVAPLPYITKPATLQYSWFMGVMNDSQHKTAAWNFLQWFDTDVQANGTTRYGDLLTDNIGSIPDRKVDFYAAANKPVLGDFFTSVFLNQMSDSVAEPNVMQASTIKNDLMNEIQDAWAGQVTAQQALDDACNQINPILQEYY
jgi:multiple sugar transport system substrate-binding protein